MRFMMLFKSDARIEAGDLPDQATRDAMAAYNQELARAGAFVAAEGLQPTAAGARVRMSGGEMTVVRGPFLPAGQLIAGYWMVQVASRAEAIEWARRVPGADGEIEVRAIYELDDFPVDPAERADGWRDQERAAREAAAPARKAGTARFIAMLKSDAVTESAATPSEKVLARMGAVMQELVASGAMLGGEGLKPSAHGARVRRSGARRTVIDGPFTESKEMIAGYSIVQARSIDEAVDYARRWLPIHVDEVVERGGAG
jgi:hypothetical protein